MFVSREKRMSEKIVRWSWSSSCLLAILMNYGFELRKNKNNVTARLRARETFVGMLGGWWSFSMQINDNLISLWGRIAFVDHKAFPLCWNNSLCNSISASIFYRAAQPITVCSISSGSSANPLFKWEMKIWMSENHSREMDTQTR